VSGYLTDLPTSEAPTEVVSADEVTRLRFEDLPPIDGRGSRLATEWWIAWRHLRAKKTEAFLSLTTVLSIVGVASGVALLNWVTSVMTGFEVDLRDKILGASAHVVVFRFSGNVVDVDETVAKLEGIDGVAAASPFVYTEVMLRGPAGGTGVVLKGLDPERTGRVTHLAGDLHQGYDPLHGAIVTYDPADDALRLDVLRAMGGTFPPIGPDGPLPPTEDEPLLPGIIVGQDLADKLHVAPGSKLQLINPLGGTTGPMGMPTPSVRLVRVAATFDSGMYEYDTKWMYSTNALAQDFLKLGDAVTGIEMRASDIDDVERIALEANNALGYPHYARHWKEMNAKLFQALALEKWVTGLLLELIVFNAGLLVVTCLVMVVITKGREIAILKAMGATRGTIVRVFLMEGAAIGGVGTAIGTVLGVAGCAVLDRYRYPLETDVYYLDTLPVVIDPVAVVVIALAGFTTCVVCTIYPAVRAGRLDPVEGLRYS
jgi:lipoprotein-releasing system permease protein